MGGSSSHALLDDAWEAFARADWEQARALFASAVTAEPSGEALDGLGQALLWCGDEEGAIETRTKAFAEYRRRGKREAAANVAIYLAGEYRIAGNASLANGWLGRGQRLLEECGDCPGRVWLEIELSKRAATPDEAEKHALRAVELAQRIDDAGLEAAALSHAGLARVSRGDVDDGLPLLDEAIAIATGAEATDPLSIVDACCTTLVACEHLADPQRSRDWGEAISQFMRRRKYAPLSPWCRAVYGGFLITTGEWQQAERELKAAAEEAARLPTPHRTAAPPVRLADLRLRQGRIEEAGQLLAGLEDRLVALGPVVELHLARGELDLAAERVEQRLEAATGESELLRAQLHLLQARVELARSDPEAARAAIEAAGSLASHVRRDDLLAAADVLAARAARLRSEPADVRALEIAVARLSELGMPLEEAAARLELAQVLASERTHLAVEQGRAALAAFERLGAARHADEAAAVLRGLGARGRPVPRSGKTLTMREREVLVLLREGLSNAAIAERLVISPRTAEHHVRSILAKLGLRNRAEAAAYAAAEAVRGRS